MYNQIDKNKRNTRILMMFFVVLVLLLGYGLGWLYSEGNPDGAIGFMGIFGIVAVVYAGFSYYMAGKITLSLARAKPIEKRDHRDLYNVVENLSIAAGIPTPKIYMIHDKAPNAFATGRDPKHAYVAVTTGLLEIMDKSELQGVMAHEISHIQNYDIRVQSITVALLGLIAFVADVLFRSLVRGSRYRSSSRNRGGGAALLIGLVMALVSLLFAKLMHLAISRQREYLADASGALLTRYPEGLARALEKLQKDQRVLRRTNQATAHLYIESPLEKEARWDPFKAMLNTHPPMKDRIARLRGMNS